MNKLPLVDLWPWIDSISGGSLSSGCCGNGKDAKMKKGVSKIFIVGPWNHLLLLGVWEILTWCIYLNTEVVQFSITSSFFNVAHNPFSAFHLITGARLGLPLDETPERHEGYRSIPLTEMEMENKQDVSTSRHKMNDPDVFFSAPTCCSAIQR